MEVAVESKRLGFVIEGKGLGVVVKGERLED
jgi:hypothetical protein